MEPDETTVTVTVETPPAESTPEPLSAAPPNSDTTAALVAVATEVGATSATVEDHSARLTELEAENARLREEVESARRLALEAITPPPTPPTPEPIAEAETVTVPAVVVDDQKAPRQERGPIARMLFGA